MHSGSRSPFLIGITGGKGSGKTFTAHLIRCELGKRYKVAVINYADALKEIIHIVFGTPKEFLSASDEVKNSVKSGAILVDPSKIAGVGHKRLTVRETMQVLGTDIFRKYFGESIWIDVVDRLIKRKYSCYDYIVIGDCRFPNECEYVLSNGGILLRLLRTVSNSDAHLSEIALRDYDFDGSGNIIDVEPKDNLADYVNYIESLCNSNILDKA